MLIKRLVIVLFFFFNAFGDYTAIPPHVTLRLYQMMKDTHEIFSHYEIPYWVHGGTLLGAVRHKGIIPWDDDIDIVVEKQHEEKILKTQTIFESLGYRFIKVNYGYNILFPQKEPRDINLDIMIFVKKNDQYVYESNPSFYAFFDEKDLFPLKKYQFGQLYVWGPHNPIPYLNTVYPDWNTHAQMCNHHYFGGPTVPLQEKLLVAAQPTGPLADNVHFLKNKS